jgi:hypothetical protein
MQELEERPRIEMHPFLRLQYNSRTICANSHELKYLCVRKLHRTPKEFNRVIPKDAREGGCAADLAEHVGARGIGRVVEAVREHQAAREVSVHEALCSLHRCCLPHCETEMATDMDPWEGSSAGAAVA